jgi:hypothetical protein
MADSKKPPYPTSFGKVLLDVPAETPALGYCEIAQVFATIITESRPQFAVGIFGGWGSGKTTLMTAIKAALLPKESVVSVDFNAWRYEREPQLLIPLLDTIRAAVVQWSEGRNKGTGEKVAYLARRIGRVIRALAAGLSVEVGLPGAVKAGYDVGPALDALSSMGESKGPKSLYVAAFQELQAAFDEFSPDGDIRMVVFVDDLDRCLPSNALDLLESMKLFFDLPGFIFVVGVDETAIERAICTKLADDDQGAVATEGHSEGASQARKRFSREYVKKLFQLPYALPAVLPGQLNELLGSMYGEAALDSDEFKKLRSRIHPYLQCLTAAGRVNPREVKRFVNTYTLQMLIRPKLDSDIVLALQTIAFRYEWEPLYSAILADSELFIDVLRRYRNGQHEQSAFAELSPDLEMLPTSLATYLRSPQAKPLTRYRTLDDYLSSIRAANGIKSWKLDGYREIARLHGAIRDAFKKNSLESSADDVAVIASEVANRVAGLVKTLDDAADTKELLDVLRQMKQRATHLSKYMVAASYPGKTAIPQDQLRDQLDELRLLADDARSQLGALPSLNGESSLQHLAPVHLVDRIPLPASQPVNDDWAICCSGGGVRSAAYCLGALQSLASGGRFRKARWVLGVSGGSYIAASWALVRHALFTASPHPAHTRGEPYAPGTPEEHALRYHSRYASFNSATTPTGALLLFLKAVVTFVIALAPVYVATHAWGWLLRWQGVATPSGSHRMATTPAGSAWLVPLAIAGGGVLIFFVYQWWPARRAARRTVSWAATLTAIGVALTMLAVSPVISWLTHSTGSADITAQFSGFGARPSWSFTVAAGLIVVVTAVACYSRAGLAKWTASTAAAKGKSAAAPGLAARVAGGLRQQFLPWLASALVVLGGVVFAILWTSEGAREGYSLRQLLPVVIVLAVMAFARIAVGVNGLSMYDFYRSRLADAFAVTRQAVEEPNPRRARALFAEAAATRLSALQERQIGPGLVICGTAHINAEREVPPGQSGYCVTFDPEHVSLHREKGLPAQQRAQARTSDYEALVGWRNLTLFDISAIGGEAASPLMGPATRLACRILFTATNICLGVWLPHPNLVRDARHLLDHPDEGTANSRWERRPLLLLGWYLMPHPLWARHPDENARREARLWAHVLKLRLDRKLSGALWYRVMQPTLGLKWAEAGGRLSYRATWMYVTDGGHNDNLGLVEALRRGASNIVVLDASGDKADTWFNLGNAIALARTDAGVEIDLDPSTMTRGGHNLAPGQVVRPWAHGKFRRFHPEQGLPDEGDIWVCKLGWWTDAPWDVLAYARDHPSYPSDSTLEQLDDPTEFEAYQQLGTATVLDVLEHGKLSLGQMLLRGFRS